jgi:RNA polymerase sigma factor (sigma-70 family)
MSSEPSGELVTTLLDSAAKGDREAAARLLPIVYEELRRLARARMAGTPGGGAGNTLQPTALVHEAYMRLVGARGESSQRHSSQLTSGVEGTGAADAGHSGDGEGIDERDPGWKGRGHFFGAAAQAMRDILVEQARRKSRLKRGGKLERAGDAELEGLVDPGFELREPAEDVLKLQAALQRLEARDPRKGEIVSLRYFAGLSQAETAAALGLSERTVEREWRYIKAWLKREVGTSGDEQGGRGGADEEGRVDE